MRVLARIGFTLAGLALTAPAGALAGMPVMAGSPWSPAQQQQQKKAGPLRSGKPVASQGRERLCGECQRAKLMKEQGVNVPPPPPLPEGTVLRSNMCTACGRPAAVLAGRIATPSRVLPQAMTADNSPPGRAVVGGEAGYASTGNDPAPIGMVQPRLASAGRSAAPGGPRDPSVMPTASVASPSDPVMPKGESKPHILSHLFGFSAIGRDRAVARERRSEEEHARIPYGAPGMQPVQNLPSSVVYGR